MVKIMNRKNKKRQAIVLRILVLLCILALSGCGKNNKEREELRMSGITKMDAGDYAGAAQDFEAAIQASSGRVGSFEIDVLKYRAEAEYKLGDYGAAAHTYDVLLEVDREQPEYFYRSALTKALSGDAQGALDHYLEGVELEKKKPIESGLGRQDVLAAVGEACMDAGFTEEADSLYEQAVKDGVAGPAVFNEMGLALMESAKAMEEGDEQNAEFERAVEYFRQAVQAGKDKNDPAVKAARFNEAVVYELQYRYARALETFQTYVADYGADEAAQKEILFLQTR
jgi:tetratricopeptide (TPR) repeat protein